MKESRLQRELKEEIAHLLPRGCSPRIFEELNRMGLINLKACEELAIRHDIEQSIRGGARRVDAFTWAADRFCCSFEKARNIYYKPLKQL